MEEAEIYVALTGIFQKLFARSDISLHANTSAADMEGWDSFRQVEILLALERHYAMKFTAKELDNLESVGDLVRCIASRASAKNE